MKKKKKKKKKKNISLLSAELTHRLVKIKAQGPGLQSCLP